MDPEKETQSFSLKNEIKKIPLLNKDTANSNTFDFDRLLDKKVQKEALSSHRIKNSNDASLRKKVLISPRTTTTSKKILSSSCKLLNLKKEPRPSNEKIEKLREEKIKQELKECTFSPQILAKEKKVRSPEEYYKDQLKFRDKQQEALKAKQKELSLSMLSEISSFSYVPTITQKSSLIASQQTYPESQIDRLHRGTKPKFVPEPTENDEKSVKKLLEPEYSFSPALNPRSKNLLRISPVEEILYEDAKRRQRAQNDLQATQSLESSLNPNSEKLLIERFYKDFTEICELEFLNYPDFQIILRQMYFTLGLEKNKNKERELTEKLWKKASENGESAGNERVLMTLLAIMRYQTAIFTDSEEAISPEETESIHQKFLLFYENRVSIVNKSSVNRSVHMSPEPPYKPELCENSRKIVEFVNAEDVNKRRFQKKMEMIKEIEEKDFEECTFRPVISKPVPSEFTKDFNEITLSANNKGDALYQIAQIAKKRKEDLLEEEREKLKEQELKYCTFNPNTNKKNVKNHFQPSDIKKLTNRLSQIKEEKLIKKSLSKKEMILQGKFPKKKNPGKNTSGDKTNSKSKIEISADKERKLNEWEERKVREMKKKKQEKEGKARIEMEKESEKKRRLEEEKKIKYERLKKITEEKKAKLNQEKRMNAKVNFVSILNSSSTLPLSDLEVNKNTEDLNSTQTIHLGLIEEMEKKTFNADLESRTSPSELRFDELTNLSQTE